MTTKHTPGPLVYDSSIIETQDGRPIAHVMCDNPEQFGYLFASAPESIAANKKAITKITQLAAQVNEYANRLGLGRKIIIEDWIDDLQSVIAKAEGRE